MSPSEWVGAALGVATVASTFYGLVKHRAPALAKHIESKAVGELPIAPPSHLDRGLNLAAGGRSRDITPKFANPAALGLGALALTTFVLSVHNAGLAAIGAALPLGLFYGGLAQLIAGFLEFDTGNTFGMTAFASYGAFWIALATMALMEINKLLSPEATKGWLLTTLIAWTIFTFILWIATFKHSKALIWVFTTLLILFILLDIGVWQGVGAGQGIMRIAGWEGILCSLAAWYLMAAIIINDAFGRTALPVGAASSAQR